MCAPHHVTYDAAEFTLFVIWVLHESGHRVAVDLRPSWNTSPGCAQATAPHGRGVGGRKGSRPLRAEDEAVAIVSTPQWPGGCGGPCGSSVASARVAAQGANPAQIDRCRRILLDCNETEVVRHGRRAGGRGRQGDRCGRSDPPASRPAEQDHRSAPELPQPGRGLLDSAAGHTHVLPQAHDGAERPQRRRGAARAVPLAQLRGRDRHRDRPHRPQHLARRGAGAHPGYTIVNDYGCATSATQARVRCCV